MLGFLLAMFLVGIIAGYAARGLVMGPDPLTFWQTVGLGVVGSFVGGTVGSLLFAGELRVGPAGIILAIPGAIVALLVYRKVKYGSIMPHRD